MKIRVIRPVIGLVAEDESLEELSAVASPDTEISTVSLDKGPASIESTYESALAAIGVVAKIQPCLGTDSR
jgi:Asp/Glu/hydantoin racemase